MSYGIQVLIVTFFFVFVLFFLWFLLGFVEEDFQSMNSSFESGFESSKTVFVPFSSQYFMVALVFLIFDLEIVMTLPLPISTFKLSSLFLVSLFILILTLLLFKELKVGSLEWNK